MHFRHGVVAEGQVRELGQLARRVECEKGAERALDHNKGREGVSVLLWGYWVFTVGVLCFQFHGMSSWIRFVL